jgi:hypothetical protein
MKYTAEEICDELKINLSDILNIYPYGSRIYGTDDEYSDSDYIIVYKKSLLPSGGFKDNAISSDDYEIQGTCYSRGGFIDAINNYQISALECIFLPEDMIIKNTMEFKMTKFYKKDFVKKIITVASASAHHGKLSYKDDDIDNSKKNMYHAIRILMFGLQIKEHGRIIDYTSTNEIKMELENDVDYEIYNWWDMFIKLSNELKN